MLPPLDLHDAVLTAWRTNSRVTDHLIAHLPPVLWSATVPGVRSRTIRAVAAHLHNSRCTWIRTLGHEHGILAPIRVDHRTATARELGRALKRSSRGIGVRLGRFLQAAFEETHLSLESSFLGVRPIRITHSLHPMRAKPPITLGDDTRSKAVASIRRYSAHELDQQIGDLKSALLLDYILAELGPTIYNQAIADARKFFEERTADLSAVCYQAEFPLSSKTGRSRQG